MPDTARSDRSPRIVSETPASGRAVSSDVSLKSLDVQSGTPIVRSSPGCRIAEHTMIGTVAPRYRATRPRMFHAQSKSEKENTDGTVHQGHPDHERPVRSSVAGHVLRRAATGEGV